MPTATKNVPVNTTAVIASRSASDTALNIEPVVYQKETAGTLFLYQTPSMDQLLPWHAVALREGG